MKLKTLFLALLCALCGTRAMAAVSATVTRVVGADLSLVPAYESAGDVWKDASGNTISDLITYMKERGLTSVRVRLMVDPSQDDYVATCQDLTYVEKLGKRIKDAGLLFLLDIFYSDGWTDVSQQWIPKSWSMTKSTATSTLAAKVKSYTTEVLNALTDYGAKPDYVQIGNEVSYGMLWDSTSGASTSNAFYTSGSYSTYSTQIKRFATLLTAAAEGVRASEASTAKIILHTERSAYSAQEVSFYTWMASAGFTDYDIIGLSYYPFWHGTLSTLEGTLSALTSSFPNKEIQIVETAYYNSSSAGSSTDTNMSGTWAYSFSGQAAFISDLASTLNNYTNVTGLYYWQPEECGNGANSSGTSQVMDSWDNRGFWDCTWKSSTHTMSGTQTLTNLVTFNHTDLSDITDDDDDETVTTDISDQFSNLDFEDCVYDSGNGYFTSVPGWTINYDAGFSDGPWAFTVDQWNSSLCEGYGLKAWNAASNALSAGNVISQTLADLPAGTYTISAVVYTDCSGFQVFANDNATDVTVSSDWGTAYTVTATTTLAETGSLSIGLKLSSAISSTSAVNLYCDNFTVTQTVTNSSGGDDSEEEGEETYPIDRTSLIGDYDFESTTGHFVGDDAGDGPWNYGSDTYLSTYNVGTNAWAANSTNILTIWGASLTSSGLVFYQTISDLPNGTYTLSADMCDENSNLYLYGGGSVSSTGAGNSSWNSVNSVSITGIEVTDGTLKIGVGVDNTVSTTASGYVDNFTLSQTAGSSSSSSTKKYYTMYDLGFENPADFKTYDDDGNLINDSTYWEYGWDTYMGDYTVKVDPYANAVLCTDSILTMWSEAVSTTGRFLTQRVANAETGNYEVTAIVHSNNSDVYLFAGSDTVHVAAGDTWGNAAKYTVTTNVTDGNLIFGLGIGAIADDEVNVYCDNFTFTRLGDIAVDMDTITTIVTDTIYKEADTSTGKWVTLGTSGATVGRVTSPTSNGSSYSTSVTNSSTSAQKGAYLPFGSSALVTGQTWKMESDFYLPYSTSSSNVAQYYQLYGGNTGTPSTYASDDNSLFTLYCSKATGTSSNTYTAKVGATSVSTSVALANNTWYHLTVSGTATSVDTIVVTPVGSTTNTFSYTTSTTTSAGYPAGLISLLPKKKNGGSDIVGYFDNETLTYTTRKDSIFEHPADSLYEFEGIWYVYRADGTAYVKGYNADTLALNTEGGVALLDSFIVDNKVYYPSYIAEWSMENFPLSWITIGKGYNCVSKGAFYNSALTSVTIYSEYMQIWDYAFTGWSDSISAAGGDGNLGTKGTALSSFSIWASDPTSNVTISSNAFCADDIKAATLWVNKAQETNSIYTALGFKNISHLGCVRGDADESGTVDVADAEALAKIITGGVTPTCICNADTNGDGSVSIGDLTEMINNLLK